jgi:hypothetical protein
MAGETNHDPMARPEVPSIYGWGQEAPKVEQRHSRADSNTHLIHVASALNAIRVLNSGGGNLTGGNIYVYGR